jgi:hypothetical protein
MIGDADMLNINSNAHLYQQISNTDLLLLVLVLLFFIY